MSKRIEALTKALHRCCPSNYYNLAKPSQKLHCCKCLDCAKTIAPDLLEWKHTWAEGYGIWPGHKIIDRMSDLGISAWGGMARLYFFLTNKNCDPDISLGMATSAVDKALRAIQGLRRRLQMAHYRQCDCKERGQGPVDPRCEAIRNTEEFDDGLWDGRSM